MRLYSNTLLYLPQIVYYFRWAARHPGQLNNYHFYCIKNRSPLVLHTYSPLEFLQENNHYYCYDSFYRDTRLERSGNVFEVVTVHNQPTDFGKETYVYIPKNAKNDDFILVKNDRPVGRPSIYFPYPIPILS
jgi:hypothetical protein